MDANEYQSLTKETEIYSEAASRFALLPADEQMPWLQLAYCVGKLNGEAGEAAEIVFKAFRGDAGHLSDEQKAKLQKELGDCMWYIARIADLIGVSLEEVMKQNIEKLTDRKTRGVVHGYGDER